MIDEFVTFTVTKDAEELLRRIENRPFKEKKDAVLDKRELLNRVQRKLELEEAHLLQAHDVETCGCFTNEGCIVRNTVRRIKYDIMEMLL